MALFVPLLFPLIQVKVLMLTNKQHQHVLNMMRQAQVYLFHDLNWQTSRPKMAVLRSNIFTECRTCNLIKGKQMAAVISQTMTLLLPDA